VGIRWRQINRIVIGHHEKFAESSKLTPAIIIRREIFFLLSNLTHNTHQSSFDPWIPPIAKRAHAMTRKKLSEEERIRRRRESNLKFKAKSRPQDTFIDLGHHPNAFANLATGELREQFVKELEDGTVQPSFRDNDLDELDYDPDED
jgi:hypothetical protein